MKIKYSILTILFLQSLSVFVKAQATTNIRLKSATDDHEFVLSKEKGKFVALHFLLKTECPYCIRHTQEYFSKAKTLKNVVQVFIKPDTELEIRAWSGKLTTEDLKNFPIYRDPDAQLAKQLNIPDGYKFHNQIVHFPATVLIGPDGKEVYRYVGKNNSDRLSFNQLEQKVNEISRK
ncbi:MAG: TlpA disulfide reductase family protein [Daejeonella sp.]|uniref:peroxiredoxin family protein n=1 Tax=Daejeonella sp. TaxID=2805397 RepID=UPI00273626E6|nr:TlpA disulfide reductase family protein [Daejeonella sp.]MDP3467633.1 TlpA disulfide reductase family protein [Daejeonella sp.]